jgi:pantetheine-phosphate adenylyltransferase
LKIENWQSSPQGGAGERSGLLISQFANFQFSIFNFQFPLQERGSVMPHRTAVYTGVFDPVHLGHLDVIRRGSRLVDRLVVGVGDNPEKISFFSKDERVELLKLVVKSFSNVDVMPFAGLAVRFVRSVGAGIMLRGLRTTSDMENEFTMSLTNLALDPEIETVFLMAKENYSHIRGALLRQIAMFGGELENFVPPEVKSVLEERARERKDKG